MPRMSWTITIPPDLNGNMKYPLGDYDDTMICFALTCGQEWLIATIVLFVLHQIICLAVLVWKMLRIVCWISNTINLIGRGLLVIL